MAPQSNEQLKTKIKELNNAISSLTQSVDEISIEFEYDQTTTDGTLLEFLKNLLSEKDKEIEDGSNSDDQTKLIEDLQFSVARLSKDLNAYKSLSEKKTNELESLQKAKPATAKKEGKIQLVFWNYSDHQRPIAHIAFKVGDRSDGQIILPRGIDCGDGFNCPVGINEEDMPSLIQYLDKNGIGYKIIE